MEDPVNNIIPKTLYAVLSLSEYYKLNQAISEAKGYNLADETARYAPMNPQLCKINIQVTGEGEEATESYNLACVMPITVVVQANHSQLLPGLVESFIPATETLTELVVEGMTTAQIDHLLMHYDAVGDLSIDLILAENQPRSSASDPAVLDLVNHDITVITYSDGTENN